MNSIRSSPDRWFIRKDGTDARTLARTARATPFGGQPGFTVKPVPRAAWPKWARLIALGQSDGDTGVGDTVHRTIGEHASRAFQLWHKLTFGAECDCARRRNQWNAQFPYQLQAVGQPDG